MTPDLYAIVSETALNADYLTLPQVAAIELGAPVLTLGALYHRAGSGQSYKTYASLNNLADVACLDESTCRRHIQRLIEAGYVHNFGRERLNGGKGKARRTNTLKLLPRAFEMRRPYLQLPRWAARRLTGFGEKFVFGLLVSRQMLKYRKELSEEFGCFDGIEEVSTTEIIRATGLNPQAVRRAKRVLRAAGWAVVNSELRTTRGDCAQLLALNPDCMVDTTPAPQKPPGESARAVFQRIQKQADDSARAPRVKVREGVDDSARAPRVKVPIAINHSSNQHALTSGPNEQPAGQRVRLDHKEFSREELEQDARYIFERLGCPLGDLGNFWRIVALQHAGRIAPGKVAFAIEGVRLCPPRNALAYFWTVLAGSLKSEPLPLAELARSVSVNNDAPDTPPRPSKPVDGAAALAVTLRVPAGAPTAADDSEQRREALAYLDEQAALERRA